MTCVYIHTLVTVKLNIHKTIFKKISSTLYLLTHFKYLHKTMTIYFTFGNVFNCNFKS